MNEQEIAYALSKQVPEIAHECRLATAYGELVLEDDDAKRVAALVKEILEARYED